LLTVRGGPHFERHRAAARSYELVIRRDVKEMAVISSELNFENCEGRTGQNHGRSTQGIKASIGDLTRRLSSS